MRWSGYGVPRFCNKELNNCPLHLSQELRLAAAQLPNTKRPCLLSKWCCLWKYGSISKRHLMRQIYATVECYRGKDLLLTGNLCRKPCATFTYLTKLIISFSWNLVRISLFMTNVVSSLSVINEKLLPLRNLLPNILLLFSQAALSLTCFCCPLIYIDREFHFSYLQRATFSYCLKSPSFALATTPTPRPEWGGGGAALVGG